ncbi:hypothetical protein ACH4E7_01685 [Kitasatospora sp. NPDC018058]|uniref:hypothetical protein n=1 Tax=Kitasatospora sp. NPDC018058 TaxID=3364025 RepID=UPI0037BE67E0
MDRTSPVRRTPTLPLAAGLLLPLVCGVALGASGIELPHVRHRLMGRLPHRRGMGGPTAEDRRRCTAALRRVRAEHLAGAAP